ncbi:MAG: thiamine phosphate synthase [Candidatus Omnitrophica bacterium]|nr:thiamine phosphate synthase [Candidatus Omnitrophota bacterium]
MIDFSKVNIYGISDTGFEHKIYFRELLEAGIDIIQLRDKNVSDRFFFDLAAEIKKMADNFGVPMIINDRVDLALALNAAGVHLGDSDLPVKAARKIMPDKIIGCTCHSFRDLQNISCADVDYISVGPVFKSPTKNELEAISPDEIKLIRGSGFNQVAIGGINLDSIKKIKSYGFNNVAMVSSLYNAKDKKSYLTEIRKVLKDDTNSET